MHVRLTQGSRAMLDRNNQDQGTHLPTTSGRVPSDFKSPEDLP